MKNIFYSTIFFLVVSCQKQIDYNSDFSSGIYDSILNPRLSDTTCINEINKAKKDITENRIAFMTSFGLGGPILRYEEDLTQLCKKNNLIYKVDLVSCLIYEGQTDGCYKAYMDRVISEKFGSDFKDKLHRKADSLFLIRVKKLKIPIYSWDCDEKPTPLFLNEKYIETTLDVDLDLKKTELGKVWPAIDLSFLIEIDGSISKFYSDNFIPNLNHNRQFKDKLYEISVRHIKSNYPKWIPGKIAGVPVRTDHNLRITFIGKN